ncbi:BppU family phage baseplate upper protein [Bacillus cereus group sp. BfR-BA-00331]|uniref:BppU family phage baseplate upper protein n=1 Tax=Bacillus cereus group sp. BfR-BA-00331 TaxID=3094866 RepID=UPI0029C3A1BA|nr:BppU family phage baseplate upper protein [Bacillus cereus group sp. BfR-BA-00331]MDX5960963.1 BppU family phage baseplate upper protein [Bacillus cereus group sp. BfR-BA-00331]
MIHLAELLKVREITIDTMQYKDFATKEEELKVMRFYQNDLNSAKLLINVTHDKVVTDFSSATSVQIAFLKPDCKRVFQDVQNVNQMQGKYYVVLSTQTLIAYGNVIAQLRFTFPNNKVIETCKFAFTVDESIMSDEAMKSTNEFPVIQKAIEAGKKFEGVDIDGIIAAGELAKGALPKTGGTMTGNFGVQIPNAGSNGISFKSTSGLDIHNWIGTSTGAVAWQDKLANTDVFNYSSVSKTLTMMNGVAFNVAGSTNLLKKTGDTLTGHLSMDVSSGEKFFRAQTGVSTYGAGISFKKSGINLFDWGSNSNILQWDSANKTLDVANGVVNTNIVTKIKDGRANLTLTADALVIDANIPPLVNRRGNTVTFRCYMQRKVGSAGNLMTTLPVDMRPVDTVFVNALGHDGTVCRVTIGTDGNVFIGSGGKETEGKQIAETITYVVN